MKRRYSSPEVQVKSGRLGNVTKLYGVSDDCLYLTRNNPRRKDGSYSDGGAFFCYHRSYLPVAAPLVVWYQSTISNFTQPFIGSYSSTPQVPISSTALDSIATVEIADAFSYGATAWKRMRPGTNEFSVLNFIRELGSDLPQLPVYLFTRLKNIRSVGSEYLNVAFGWAPLLSDIKKMYETYQYLDRKLAQLVRDNGNGIHRRRQIAETTDSTVTISGGAGTPYSGWSNPPPFWTSGTGQVVKTTRTLQKVWACGSFRYYIPDIGSSQWTRKATNALFGLVPTPEILWNAIPWTWLIDWFSNLGDVMSNLSPGAVDNVTASHAFVMRTREIVTTYEGSAVVHQKGSKSTPNDYIPNAFVYVTATDKAQYKTRVVASPFGFGLHWPDLTAKQMGIAAALGISRWA